ncbi:hypothetical protein Vadar_030120 [Vaccinium darrowii]|uniref:Uncharacterized protein n=1 Tax=Vaccinium darrowii TaxID=229202 RepID=A0ACB7X5Q3_9ERIC|nr:hypothetical protein Vadar_030120 [Vaccinium darrowii]
MGSSSSKPNAAAAEAASASSSSSVHSSGRRSRSRVFQSACLRPPSGSNDSDDDEQSQENGCNVSSGRQIKQETDQVKAECYRKVKAEQPDATTCISSSTEYDEWGQSNLSNSVSRAGCSSSIALSTPSLSRSSRFLTRFRLFPSNTSFKLSRTTSLGSSRAYPVSATSFTGSNEDDQLDLHRNEPQRGRNFLPACLITRSPPPPYGDFASGSLEPNLTTSAFGDNLREDHTTSHLNVARDVDNARGEFNVNSHSSRNDDIDSIETRLGDRRMERNVRFSRTLSVGRLRDRVLRRSSFPDFTFSPLEQDREVRDASQQGGTQALSGGTGASASNDNALMSSSSSSSCFNWYAELILRSNFLERRRRIRSQVHALQRLGSRFENLSGHERSCIISGQHRTGHCTCPIRTQNSNSSDDTSARASISRIVMLAEALFEVLDEIHQQSVVILPNVSSTGSVPAPHEVVEALPVKLYSKSPKHLCEEVAQCYICLVEYEGGDSVRILPCNHEFHRSCVDKWLKEIHRVCPLCRGDICGPDTVSSAN